MHHNLKQIKTGQAPMPEFSHSSSVIQPVKSNVKISLPVFIAPESVNNQTSRHVNINSRSKQSAPPTRISRHNQIPNRLGTKRI